MEIPGKAGAGGCFMEKFLFFFHGYVVLSVHGSQLERFLNLCRNRGIFIRHLTCLQNEELRFVLSLADFWKLPSIPAKTGVHIHILKKCGLPFFFNRNKKRKAFFAGILFCLLLLFLCSTRIWNIHIEGNIAYSTPEILGFLKEEDVVHGMAKREVHCQSLAAKVREQFPKITWVSARIEGTQLILTVQEGKGLTREEKIETSPCNLSASQEGTIVKIITRSGVPLVKPGDVCRPGDILVQGRLEIQNDSKEIVRYEYMQADADIYIRHDIAYYHEFPLKYEKSIPEGTVKKRCYLRVGDWQAGAKRPRFDGWNCTEELTHLRLTENFRLPVWIGTYVLEKQKTIRGVYSEEEAMALAKERLYDYEENLMEKGVQIYKNNVKIEMDYELCKSSGSLTVIEKTGEQTPAEYLEQPQERTAQDGQQHY